jgi:hypothetical protein
VSWTKELTRIVQSNVGNGRRTVGWRSRPIERPCRLPC